MRKQFFKKSHQAWFVHHGGKMVRLGPDKAEAHRKYHELMASESASPVAASETVVSLLNSYLHWCEKNRSAQTYAWYRHFLSSFARSVGVRLQIAALKPLHVTRWFENPKWNDTTRSHAVRAVRRAFNWAVKQERLAVSPVRNVELPTAKRREAFVTRTQFAIILAAVRDRCFRDYLTFLFETGCRPQEIKIIEARHCDLEACRVVLPASKAKGKKFPRVIYFTEELAPLVARLCVEYPTGPIFRNLRCQPWIKDSINCRLRRLRFKLANQKNPMEGLCATAFRHRSLEKWCRSSDSVHPDGPQRRLPGRPNLSAPGGRSGVSGEGA